MSPPTQAHEAPQLRLRLDETVPVLDVPEDLTFERIRDVVREELPSQLADLGGRSIRLDLGNRGIKLLDVRRLVHLLGDEFKIEVTGLFVRAPEIHRFAERELKLRLFPTSLAPIAAPPPVAQPPAAVPEHAPEPAEIDPPTVEVPTAPIPLPIDELVRAVEPPSDGGRRTLTVQRTLRSGTTVRFDGDVVVLGDVNPGAQIVASGSAIVLGICKGMVHVGATGDATATVIALDLEPTQLRIGRRIAVVQEPGAVPEGARQRLLAMFSPTAPRALEPRIARVVDDAIVVSAYRPQDLRPIRAGEAEPTPDPPGRRP